MTKDKLILQIFCAVCAYVHFACTGAAKSGLSDTSATSKNTPPRMLRMVVKVNGPATTENIEKTVQVLRLRLRDAKVVGATVSQGNKLGQIAIDLPASAKAQMPFLLSVGRMEMWVARDMNTDQVSIAYARALDDAAEKKKFPNAKPDPETIRFYTLHGENIFTVRLEDTTYINQCIRELPTPSGMRCVWGNVYETEIELFFLKEEPNGMATVTSRDIDQVKVLPQQDNLANVAVALNIGGKSALEKFSDANKGRQVVVLMDGQSYSVGQMQSGLARAQFFNLSSFLLIEQAEELAAVLRHGQLPAPLTVVSETPIEK